MGMKLPQDIVLEILLRVPVKSLMRFKCACKSWCSLIINPYFIRKHINHVTLTNDSVENKSESAILLFPATNTFKTMVICDEDNDHEGNDDRIVTVKELDFPPEIWHNSATKLAGSCDGLLCIVLHNDSVVLWNPSIKEFRRLPFSLPRPACIIDLHGLGHDSSLDDYKVLRASFSPSNNLLVEVFTLKTNSLRTIPGEFPFPYEIPPMDCAKFTSGGIHWFGTHEILRIPVIVCFDVAKEEFKVVPLPDYDDDDDMVFTRSLELFRGCLCVDRVDYGSHIVFWVMKEYGVRESWVKLLSVPHYPGPVTYFDLLPMYLTKNGAVLLRILEKRRTILYSHKDGTFSELDNCDIGTLPFLRTAYVESLVSPNGW